MRDKWFFADAQDLSALDSTGVIASNHVFDLELSKSGGETIIQDDFIDCWIDGIILAAPTTQAGAEGLIITAYANDNADLTTGTRVELARYVMIESDIRAGKKFSFHVYRQLTAKFFGVWFAAHTTTLTTSTTTVDCWMHHGPVGENEDIQKVPSR